jgi:uncharacterized phage-associated protein
MAQSPRLVANAFLFKAQKQGVSVTHMKLQKLVFFTHAWGLALHGESLLTEKPQSWPHGPVFDSLFHDLKTHGTAPVSSCITELHPESGNLEALMPSLDDHPIWDLINQVWDRYGKFNDKQMSHLCTEEDGAWAQARFRKIKFIPDDMIRDHYREKLNPPDLTKTKITP